MANQENTAPTARAETDHRNESERPEAFPLTDLQKAYLVGRRPEMELGGVAIHLYVEVEGQDIDLPRLEQAWNLLIERHEMLRAVVLDTGLQQILKNVPRYRIPFLDLSRSAPQEVRETLDGLRDRLSHRMLATSRWPVFDLRATVLPEGMIRIHISLDGLLVDMHSRHLLFQEWGLLYSDPGASLQPIAGSFRDFALACADRKKSTAYQTARQYWLDHLDDLPGAPELPIGKAAAPGELQRFSRIDRRLPPRSWRALKEHAGRLDIRPAVVLITAFSEVLGMWSTTQHFLLNLTLFDRAAQQPGLSGVVGDFTSTTLLAADTRQDQTFAERCRAVRQQLKKDLAHSSFTGVEVARELAKRNSDAPGALAPVVFTGIIGDTDMRTNPLRWLGRSVFAISQTPQVTLDLQVTEEEDALVVNFDVVKDRFPPDVPEQIARAYERLLCLLAENKGRWQEKSTLLRRAIFPQEHLQVCRDANAAREITAPGVLHALVDRQALKTPERPAVIAHDRVLSYRELMVRARRLAGRLRERGVARDELVAVVLEKGWQQVVATLGVLYAGAAYLPLDPSQPQERLHRLMELGAVRQAISTAAHAESLRWAGGPDLLDADDEKINPHPEAGDSVEAPESLAYVIFTSGTTGTPKGVMIEHGAAANTIAALAARYCLGEDDRVLGLSPLGFDLSVFDIFGPLSTGGALVLPPPRTAPDPGMWLELLEQHQVTLWNTTPETMDILVEHVERSGRLLPAALRLVWLSGDRIPVDLPGRIHALHPSVEIVSLGGATEGSIWSILYSIQRLEQNASGIPYGRALSGQEILVVGPGLEPRPLWAVGEIAIAGKGLARGYWKDPVRTDESFVVDPQGRRLYLTGDLGRLRPDGAVEILGRKDDQVKIRGFRVEPGEIEATLLRHTGVRSAVVIALGSGANRRRLAAYAVPAKNTDLTPAALKAFLAERLPAHMLPHFVVLLDDIPVTANGKVDRRALPNPGTLPAGDEPEKHAADTDLEQEIRRILDGLLNTGPHDLDASLLDMGVDSLDMMRLSLRLEQHLGVHLRMESLYAQPTIRAIARKCRAALPEAAEKTEPRPLLDPALRDSFKKEQPGIRRDTGPGYPLPDPRGPVKKILGRIPVARRLVRRFGPDPNARKSVRHFRSEPVPLRELAKLVAPLRQRPGDGRPQYRYASAGALYPIQVYLYVKPGRVEGIPAGGYYYHPVKHELVPMGTPCDNGTEREAYDPPFNRAIFDRSAFALFLVARMAAIEPIYGRRSWHYAVLEAGLVSQLLETETAGTRLGLCQIGDLNFDRLRHLFGLDAEHRLAHSLVGGLKQQCAASCEGLSAPDRSLVSRVADGGPGAPVFCLPGAGGFSISVRLLAEQLGDAQPIYVIRYPGIYDDETPAQSVEELARILRAEAKQEADGRPWRLLGFSFGGSVAFAMARQALAAGEAVDLLALINAAVPDYLRTHPEALQSVLDPVISAQKRTKPSAEDDLLPSRHGLLRTTRASVEAQERYRPDPYDGHIVIVRSEGNRDAVEQGFDRWEPLTLRGSTTVWVPGSKHLHLQGSLLPEFGQTLREILAGRHSPPA